MKTLVITPSHLSEITVQAPAPWPPTSASFILALPTWHMSSRHVIFLASSRTTCCQQTTTEEWLIQEKIIQPSISQSRGRASCWGSVLNDFLKSAREVKQQSAHSWQLFGRWDAIFALSNECLTLRRGAFNSSSPLWNKRRERNRRFSAIDNKMQLHCMTLCIRE